MYVTYRNTILLMQNISEDMLPLAVTEGYDLQTLYFIPNATIASWKKNDKRLPNGNKWLVVTLAKVKNKKLLFDWTFSLNTFDCL